MRCFLTFTLILGASLANAGNIPFYQESFLDRTDITKLAPLRISSESKAWQRIKVAQLAFIAELLVLYPPDTHFYFLARDAEYIYDMARLILAGTRDADRLHLLNISRSNLEHFNQPYYIDDNGISGAAIQDGRRILFIDTGFSGTIISQVQSQFGVTQRKQILGQLLKSHFAGHFPSSQVFLKLSNPKDQDSDDIVYDIESLPKKTQRSFKFEFEEGRIHPVSTRRVPPLDWYYRYQSQKLRRNLVEFWRSPATQDYFQILISEFSSLKHYILTHPRRKLPLNPSPLGQELAKAFRQDVIFISVQNEFPSLNETQRSQRPEGISLCLLTFHLN